VFFAVLPLVPWTSRDNDDPDSTAALLSQAEKDDIAVYLVRGDQSCTYCVRLKRYSTDVISTQFHDWVQQGKLTFATVSQTAAAESYDFDSDQFIPINSFILLRIAEGETVASKTLNGPWLLRGDGVEKFKKQFADDLRSFGEDML